MSSRIVKLKTTLHFLMSSLWPASRNLLGRVRWQLFAILFLLPTFQSFAQEKTLTLQDVIELAKKQSPAAKKATNNLQNRFWQYKNYRSTLKPQLALNGTLPDFSRAIQATPQNDGSIAFRPRVLSSSSLNLGLTQNIAATNSQIFIRSDLQRIDLFSPTTSTNYLASPAIIGINQPIFTFNSFKWDNKIEPLKFEESKRGFTEEMESVSQQASQLFFNLLVAQISYNIQLKNRANNDTLYRISKGRFNLGKIAENELLQMELNVMNAINSLSQAEIDVEMGNMQLMTFLKIDPSSKIKLAEPKLIPQFEVEEKTALEQAKKNRATVIAIERKRLEATRDVDKAKADNGLNANLTAQYGLTQSSAIFNQAFVNPQNQQNLQLGFSLPIITWGKTTSQVRTALANKELTDLNLEQEQQNFEQEIIILVKQIKIYREKLIIAHKSDTIANKRYDLTMKRYMIGKISITDLNIALQEKDNAKRAYVEALRSYWNVYFDLRKKTLYDFEGNTILKNE
jgi:outer membrane protein